MNQPLISIIIPSFNSENFISQTLESVLSQTYKKWECIIVDDGSTDKTKNLVNEFCTKDRRFKFFHRDIEPKGAPTCRNIGFEKSNGEYIQYLDADDLLSNDKLTNQVLLLSKFEKPLHYCVFCRTIRFLEDRTKDYEVSTAVHKNYTEPLSYIVDGWKTGCYTGIHGWLIPRDIILQAGDWDENRKIQDGEFIFRVLQKCSKIYFDNKSTAYYRDTQNSISKEISLKRKILIISL